MPSRGRSGRDRAGTVSGDDTALRRAAHHASRTTGHRAARAMPLRAPAPPLRKRRQLFRRSPASNAGYFRVRPVTALLDGANSRAPALLGWGSNPPPSANDAIGKAAANLRRT